MSDFLRVKRLREYLELSENQFSKRIGVAQTTYNRFEKGLTSLPGEALAKIARLFSVDTNWLLLGEGGEDPVFSNREKNIVSEPSSNYVTILKDELIDLQRKALKREEEKNEELKKQISQLKND
ncbi:hypothetical protein GCM10027275_25230 [Rhabdobacter roseus]|uniref:Transcriptional regulator with XRE-family HTH domain n=1 Tax=Rhabdobacter roseus TaxID=1655419 RepID=A0A840TM30_9BACT|nr:helix-turn-helix transcriptional regulator [Rhabdobacter roseus]MBB5284464.1 transcriptional regulator with XRE-family HTH domain [Rhabdobacter roseus]